MALKTAILACKTLRHEIEKACEKYNIDYPIHWIESGLHNYPEKLHKYILHILYKTHWQELL